MVKRLTVGQILSLWIATLLSGSLSAAADAYVRASIDEMGQLRIVTNDRRQIAPRKEAGQVGFDKVAISSDGRSVGWVALYPNCCTSYPVPLKLMIYSNGRLRKFAGSGLPIWRWRFESGDKQVAFEQETVHGGLGTHYELRDLGTGRLIAEYNPPVDRDNRPMPGQDIPKWVKELDD
jgi:hypothetical protein